MQVLQLKVRACAVAKVQAYNNELGARSVFIEAHSYYTCYASALAFAAQKQLWEGKRA